MKLLILALAFGVTGLATGSPGSIIPSKPSEREVLDGIAQSARDLMLALSSLEQKRPLSKSEVDLNAPSDSDSSLLLADLYLRSLSGEQPGESVTFGRWPELFDSYAHDLRRKWSTETSVSSLQDAFYALHLGYTRSIVAAYVALEITKRSYLIVLDPSQSESSRGATRAHLQSLHASAQRCLRWMHAFREDPRFSKLIEGSPYELGAWESRWARELSYNFQLRPQDYTDWTKEIPLVSYLSTIDRSLSNLVDKKPATGIPIKTISFRPPPDKAKADPTRDRVLLVIERLHGLLEKPEIQQSEEMKGLIEELIHQLRLSNE
jgi:hypothetical protein